MLQGDLRVGECRFYLGFLQLPLYLAHGFDRQRQFFLDNFVPVVGLHDRPASDAPYDCLDPVADTRLCRCKQLEIFLVGLVAKGMTVANHLEGSHDELLLLLRQMSLLLATLRATATGTAASLLVAPIIVTEGAHLVKEDIAGCGFVLVGRRPVLGVDIIGNQVAGTQAEIFEVNGMLGVDLLPGTWLIRRRHQFDALLGFAVDRQHQFQPGDTLVVAGAHF